MPGRRPAHRPRPRWWPGTTRRPGSCRRRRCTTGLAARIAAERSGHREAIAFLTRAIELARELPDRDEGLELEVELQLALGSSIATRSYSDPSLAVAYERARELCELIGNDERIGQALGGLSVYYLNHGDIALGAELAERVLAIAEVSDDGLLEVLGTVQLSLARSFQGRAPESLALANRALAAYHPERHRILGHRFGTDQGVAAHVFAGWSHLLLGHLDRGLAQLAEAVRLADSIGQPFNRVLRPGLPAPPVTANGASPNRPSTSPSRPAGWPRSRASPSGPASAACGSRPSV